MNQIIEALTRGITSMIFVEPEEAEPIRLEEYSDYLFDTQREAADAGLIALNEAKKNLAAYNIRYVDQGTVESSAEVTLEENGTYIPAVTTVIDFMVETTGGEDTDLEAVSRKVIEEKKEKIRMQLQHGYYIFDELSENDVRSVRCVNGIRTTGTISVTYASCRTEKISLCKIQSVQEARIHAKNPLRLKSNVIKAIEAEGGIFLNMDRLEEKEMDAVIRYVPGEKICSKYISYSDYEDAGMAQANADELFLTSIDTSSNWKDFCPGLISVGNITSLTNNSTAKNVWKEECTSSMKYRYHIFAAYRMSC